MNELSTLPQYDANRFYKWIAKMTEMYFEIPENKKRFEEWKKEREAKSEK